MLEVHCTKKLRNLLGLNIDSYPVVESEVTTLGSWYANIFNVEYDPYLYDKANESYLLMINTDSLLSFCIHIPEELSIAIFIAELPEYIKSCFIENNFTQRQMDYLLPGFREVGISKAVDRSMLGYLRSFAYDYEDQIIRNTPYDMDDLEEFNTIRSKLKCPNDMPRRGLQKPTAKRTARYLASTALRCVR